MRSVDNPAGGRLGGQALFSPAAHQCFALQVSGYDAVWPIIGAQASAVIADALPGGTLIGR